MVKSFGEFFGRRSSREVKVTYKVDPINFNFPMKL